MIFNAASLGMPASHSRIGGTISPSSNTLVACEGIEPGTAPPMSSWWPNACTNATTVAVVEDRHGDAQVGQVPDAALGQVDVVVEEHVTGAHRLHRIVAHHRLDQRRVRPAGELAQPAVVDAGPEVVRVADHRRARGAPDRGLHLLLDRGQATLRRSPAAPDRPRPRRRPRSHQPTGWSTPGSSRPGCPAVDGGAKPGCSGTVEPYSSMTAGPATHVARRPGRPASRSGCPRNPPPVEAHRPRLAARRRRRAPVHRRAAGAAPGGGSGRPR